ncbi:MAG: hypothetical protein ACLFV4_01620 [Candidatus Hydrogenedentota bacterium]
MYVIAASVFITAGTLALVSIPVWVGVSSTVVGAGVLAVPLIIP